MSLAGRQGSASRLRSVCHRKLAGQPRHACRQNLVECHAGHQTPAAQPSPAVPLKPVIPTEPSGQPCPVDPPSRAAPFAYPDRADRPNPPCQLELADHLPPSGSSNPVVRANPVGSLALPGCADRAGQPRHADRPSHADCPMPAAPLDPAHREARPPQAIVIPSRPARGWMAAPLLPLDRHWRVRRIPPSRNCGRYPWPGRFQARRARQAPRRLACDLRPASSRAGRAERAARHEPPRSATCPSERRRRRRPPWAAVRPVL